MIRTDRNTVLKWSAALIVALCLLPFAAQLTHASERYAPKQTQDQAQGQQQEQQQEQGQEQGQEQSLVGGTQTINNAAQVHSAFAPSVFSTSPCYYGGSAAIGLKGVNIGGGRSKKDLQCEMRETAMALIGAGEVSLGVMLLCNTEAAASLGDACKPSVDLKARLAQLETRNQVLLAERAIDRQQCEDSKDRIAQGMQQACQK